MSEDLVSRTLRDVGLTGVFYARAEMAGDWGIAMPSLPGTMVFHLVTSGEALLDVEGERSLLTPGRVVLVPRGRGHSLVSDETIQPTPLFDLPRTESSERHEVIRVPGDGPTTDLVCGAVGFTGLGMARLVASLPPVLVTGGEEETAWVLAALGVIAAESRNPRPGTDVVTSRLADVLVVHALRTWLETSPPAVGWVAALRDESLGPALAAFHAEPERPWTLAALAGEALMSSSAFAARFSAIAGEPAMSYVTAWRMELAARLLREGDLPLSAVALRVGYQSESAFNRAFRRTYALTPGAFARQGSLFTERVSAPV